MSSYGLCDGFGVKLGEAVNGLRKLDATPDDSHHRLFRVRCNAGHVVGVTKVSHKPAGTDLGPALVGAMATQLVVSRRLWIEIAGCTHGRDDYLAARDHARCGI